MRPKRGRFTPLPTHGGGQRIGLYGGSFNPPHPGHAQVVRTALARLGLDVVWVLVTPGNPLKDTRGLPDIAARAEAFRALLPDHRVVVTDLESRAGLIYSRDLVRYLRERAPRVRFVWIMGADNLGSLHRWQGWREIAATFPMAIVDRPGSTFTALSAPAALAFGQRRRPEHAARRLADQRPPAWVFLHGRRSLHASRLLRGADTRTAPP